MSSGDDHTSRADIEAPDTQPDRAVVHGFEELVDGVPETFVFYDQTGRVLVPDPVFIPQGEQTATNLVRGLLAGPGRTISDVSRSALPSRPATRLY